MKEVLFKLNINAQVVGFGSVFHMLFTDKEIENYRDVLTTNDGKYEKFQRESMKRHVFIIPKANKRCHISAAHTIDDINMTIEAMENSLKSLS